MCIRDRVRIVGDLLIRSLQLDRSLLAAFQKQIGRQRRDPLSINVEQAAVEVEVLGVATAISHEAVEQQIRVVAVETGVSSELVIRTVRSENADVDVAGSAGVRRTGLALP